MRSPRRTLGASILALEAFVVALAGLVGYRLSGSSSPGTVLAVCAGLGLACLVVAGLLRSPAGFALGWLVQVAVVATGVWVPAMFGVGPVFALLWLSALTVGARIERDRAAWARRGSGTGA